MVFLLYIHNIPLHSVSIHFLIKSHQGTGKKTYADFYPNTDFHFELTEELKEQTWKSKPRSAWEKVKAVRQVERPSALDYMDSIFDIFVEAHGDRGFADDKALIGGIGFIEGQPVTVVADIKGKDFKERGAPGFFQELGRNQAGKPVEEHRAAACKGQGKGKPCG